MGRDPKLFHNPLEFQPERWLRAEGQDSVEKESGFNLSLANLPWGHGARMCIGKEESGWTPAILSLSSLLAVCVSQNI